MLPPEPEPEPQCKHAGLKLTRCWRLANQFLVLTGGLLVRVGDIAG